MLHKINNTILYLTEKKAQFSNYYLSVRNKEKRILDDDEVFILPKAKRNNPNYKEWSLREKSAKKFINYIKDEKPSNILEIGCGNGWFSNVIASQMPKSNVYGLDINSEELEQANRVFKQKNLQFIYADIFELDKEAFPCRFNIIVLNASIQYFENIEALLLKLKAFTTKDSEVHIMDTFFYNSTDINAAIKRTERYYEQIGNPEMSAYYYHHLYSDVKGFKILYQPSNSILHKILRIKDSPFLWISKKLNNL